ncbi:Phosphoglycolate phosphatase [Streptococcus macedonicus]|uniref:Phosphoglycolate phosphatase n=1 Tax=Streptococcus gallolyticus TaxID=315405 RepID=A0A380K447_9STRE|nr:Phosphoglycolate phosphatase [Streptococcus macedonicus]SUN58968.1 phosphoglycolate phosphatase [Streptococcus gallolyticus]
MNGLGYSLYVTTSKHEPMAKLMLTELGVISNFKQVYGSTPEHIHTADVINACLTEQVIQAAESVIIGDTKFDMIGG